MKVLSVVGARPNFVKVAPVHQALAQKHDAILIHTGQHYDTNMSDVFFDQLGMPKPDHHLGVGSGSHGAQTAAVMEQFEPVLCQHKPDWVLVAGDVNSTVACALVAAKCHVRVAHLEAGLRSGDRRMPEEINRILTDRISDLLLTPSPDADEHLRGEGIEGPQVVRVGNAMIDSLLAHLPKAQALGTSKQLGLPERYGVITLHRPSNVDDPEVLIRLLGVFDEIATELPLIFPLHPRTRARLEEQGLTPSENVHCIDPVGYLEFLDLQASATVVLTDSGGIQEETTALGVPCITLRESTERPITVIEGTNQIVGTDPVRIREAFVHAQAGDIKGRRPELWDGQTASRVVAAIETH